MALFTSFRARFARDVQTLLARATHDAPVQGVRVVETSAYKAFKGSELLNALSRRFNDSDPLNAPLVLEEDLVALPPLMQAYLRRVGAVGRPRVRNMRVTFAAQMRSGANASWMTATATQYEFFEAPARLFHMKASRGGIPFDVLHRYVDGVATFQVRVAGLIPMVNKHGPGITHDETVTLMNDVLVMAPAAVLDLPFTFEPAGARALRAVFQNAGYTVSAVLTFDDAGDLVGFTSDDRSHDREGGAATWSTPIVSYREVDGIRVAATADANWIEGTGEWTYGRFEITSLAYNVVA